MYDRNRFHQIFVTHGCSSAVMGVLQCKRVFLAQVSALNAIMELVRGQQVGVFDKGLFGKALIVLLQSQTVDEETLQLLLSKYMAYVDVR